MNLNVAHLHLLMNHVPTIGFGVALGLFAIAIMGRSDELKQASLAIFFVIALFTIPTYVTGKAAEGMIGLVPGLSQTVSKPSIDAHEDAALLAFLFMEITGAFAFVGLWQARRSARPTRGDVWSVLALSVVTFVLMARAAYIGGEIRHLEIRPAQEAGATVQPSSWVHAATIGLFVNGHTWVWPTSETLHFVGLCLLFGVVIPLNLRMFGMMKNVSFAAIHQLLPWGMLGFAVNLLTGMLFFLGNPDQYLRNVTLFMWKMILVVVAGANGLYFMVSDQTWALEPGRPAPLTSKMMAALALVLWLGILFCGHMLPFIGGSF